jgi:hypothetical protein
VPEFKCQYHGGRAAIKMYSTDNYSKEVLNIRHFKWKYIHNQKHILKVFGIFVSLLI